MISPQFKASVGLFLFLSFSFQAEAQLSISTPNSDTPVKACDDYFEQRLGNSVDMNDTADINNYLTDIDVYGLSNTSFSSGHFNFTTNGANQGIFYLFSPDICFFHSAVGGSRWGNQLPLMNSSVATKYHQLAVRMYIDPSTPETNGIAALFNRSCDASQNYTITNYMPVKTGWNTYRIDLSNSSNISGSSPVSTNWSTGSITGLAIKPATESGRIGKIDYIRLEDPDSCASVNVNFTASSTGSASLYNLYIDDDTDPTNGYFKKLVEAGNATGADSESIDLDGLAPDSYYVTGFLGSDVFSLMQEDPLDFSNSADIDITSNITGGTFSGGTYSGTTAASDQQIYFNVPSDGIDTSKYRYLSLKLTRSNDGSNGQFLIYTNNGGMAFSPGSIYHIGGGVYNIDLGAGVPLSNMNWTGTKTDLILRPATASAVTFSIDWLYLTKDGFKSSQDSAISAQMVSSSGQIVINNPPVLTILEPDYHGGEAVKAWNMRPDDLKIYSNLRSDADPSYPGETYTTYLPDVRTVEGLRGDFFKGTNVEGDGDPNFYFTFPTLPNNFTFNSTPYKTICMKMLLDHVQDYCLGTLARYTAVNEAGEFSQTIGVTWIYDNWTSSKWSPDLCIDATTINLDSSTPWPTTITGLRIDAHEFSNERCENGVPVGDEISVRSYVDYLNVTRLDVTRGAQYAISFSLTDPDGDTPTVSFYYSSSNAVSGGTLIGTGDSTDSYVVWDTSAVPSGTYYVYGVAEDSYNSTSIVASGQVEVGSLSATSDSEPILSLESPVESQAVCDTLQIKGYALEPDRNEKVTVHVEVDGDAFATFTADLYSPAAVSAYPSLDSSNSGFNKSYDSTGISNGTHTVVVKAVSTDGDITSESMQITKQASGCDDPISDPEPAGTPVNVNPDGTSGSQKPVVKSAKIKGGNLVVQVKNAKDTGLDCSVSLYSGKKTGQVTKLQQEVTPNKATIKITKKAKKAKQIKFVKVTKNCGVGLSTSEEKAVKVAP